MIADLIASGLIYLLSGGTTPGVGFFGGGGLFNGLFGANAPTNNITVNPTPINFSISPIAISRAAEQGDIMRGR